MFAVAGYHAVVCDAFILFFFFEYNFIDFIYLDSDVWFKHIYFKLFQYI